MPVDLAQVSSGKPEKRVALVIGNGRYANAVPLDNPPQDARAMAALLRSLDFEVVDGIDLDVKAMDARINDFARRIADADTALFFFAGHGLQVDGENYLVPVDAELGNESQLQRQTIRLQDQLNMMSGRAAVSILLLDCCRDNPFVRSLAGRRPNRTRGGVARGLAEVGVDEGSFIAFATGPGSVAKDGDGEHSPFTEALLSHVGTPDQSLADIMTDVTDAVTAATGEQQVPWYHSSLRRRFYFRRSAQAAQKPPPADGKPAVPAPQDAEPPPAATTPALPAREPPPAPVRGDGVASEARPPETPRIVQGVRSRLPLGLAAAAIAAIIGGAGVYYRMSHDGGASSTTSEKTPETKPALTGNVELSFDDQPPNAASKSAGKLLDAEAVQNVQNVANRPAETGARLVDGINAMDEGMAHAIAARLSDDAAPFEERRRLLRTVAAAAQYQVYTVQPSDPIPATCRAPTPARPGDTGITLVCAGLAAKGQALLLSILAAVPPSLWTDPRLEAERKLALLASADLVMPPEVSAGKAGWQVTAEWPTQDNWPISQFRHNLGLVSRPADLVTLQFAGDFLRGNAQLIMDRLVAFGWKLQGVQRTPTAAGLDEVRFGSAQGAGADAAALAADLALQGLNAPPKTSPAIGARPQLDIYVSTPLATWTDRPPAYAWCYQEFDGAKLQGRQYLLACHPSKPACLDARGHAPNKRQSDCTFQENPDGVAGLKPGGWANSWFAEGGAAFPAPMPALPL